MSKKEALSLVRWANANQGWIGLISIVVTIVLATAVVFGGIWVVGTSVIVLIVLLALWWFARHFIVQDATTITHTLSKKQGDVNVRESTSGNSAYVAAAHGNAPMPVAIIHDVNSRPPYQRDSVRESYQGRRVEWPVQLINIRSGSRSKWKIMLRTIDGASFLWVHCEVNLNDYPELKTINSETFTVGGRITKFELSEIDLEDVRFTF